MEELKAMFRVCVANKKDGTRCNSPALKGGNFCFQHIGGSIREHTRARSIYNGPKLDFLYPGTRQAIQNNLYVVAQAMNDGKLELATANSYFRIFSACERNLRRFEMLYQNSAPEAELPDINDEFPNTDLENDEQNPAPSVSSVANPSPVGDPLKHDSKNEEQTPKNNDVILSEAPAGSEVEEPAFPTATRAASATPLNPSLSGGQNPSPSDAAIVEPNQEPDNLIADTAPEPPLVLTQEEREIFDDLERRYIDDPSLADRIRDTYRQIHEQRRAARDNPSGMLPC